MKYEPSKDQLTQILNGLDHCFIESSKREFLRTWIRDYAQHKCKRQRQIDAEIAEDFGYRGKEAAVAILAQED